MRCQSATVGRLNTIFGDFQWLKELRKVGKRYSFSRHDYTLEVHVKNLSCNLEKQHFQVFQTNYLLAFQVSHNLKICCREGILRVQRLKSSRTQPNISRIHLKFLFFQLQGSML